MQAPLPLPSNPAALPCQLAHLQLPACPPLPAPPSSEFDEAAFASAVGAISVVKTQYGVHVLQVTAER